MSCLGLDRAMSIFRSKVLSSASGAVLLGSVLATALTMAGADSAWAQKTCQVMGVGARR